MGDYKNTTKYYNANYNYYTQKILINFNVSRETQLFCLLNDSSKMFYFTF